jgi:hypothetical protein
MTESSLHIAEATAEYLVDPGRVRLLGAVSDHDFVERANEELRLLTGIRCFFPDQQAFEEFRRVLTSPILGADRHKDREWGDFQTPPSLASRVCHYLAEVNVSPRVIVEPTYGMGNFIVAGLSAFPQAALVYGVEVQDQYEWHLKMALLAESMQGRRYSAEIELHQDDVFTHHFSEDVLKAQDILIVGNPPWVTSAELGVLGAHNLPAKRNVKGFNGLDAVTGKSNFDIGEFILLRLLDLFSGQRGTLAMLCKNSVIKNIVEVLPRRQYRVSNIRALQIDARREFDAAVDASLLVMDLGVPAPAFTCQVAALDQPDRVARTFGWTHGRFVSDIEGYEVNADLDGKSPLVWRQGLKHDCARVMELEARGGAWVNGNGEVVEVEGEWVYWLLKGSDLQRFEVGQARKKVIVPQRVLGEDTSALQHVAPRLWDYLVRHSEHFERRKSSIYRNAPRFSIFGVGDYSFKPYKVAISGLYKRPYFSLVLPIDGCPVMFDDTCYFVGFDTYLDALFTASLLNSPAVKEFLRSIVFADAKRPYTKEVLMRIDLSRVVNRTSFQALLGFWAEAGYEPRVPVVEADFEEYRRRLLSVGKKRSSPQLSLGI